MVSLRIPFLRFAFSLTTSVFALCGLQLPSRAAAPANYYLTAEGKSGEDLKLALHKIIDKHQSVSYDSLWEHYKTTDVRPDGKPWCIYSEYPFVNFNPVQGGKPGQIGSYLNREHSWPKDWWGGTRNAAYTDLFNVILADAHVNGQKGIKPLGETAPGATVFAISKVGPAAPGLGYDGPVFEPADRYKGDFARNYLYFAIRYLTGDDFLNCSRSPMVEADGHTLKPWAIRLLMKWHQQDPVSERETIRNDAVFGIQKNRNPFIDHPEYATEIWPDAKPAPLVGVDANYSLEMEQAGKKWRAEIPQEDLLKLLRRKGANAIRIRLWTGDEGAYGLKYATSLATRAQQAGLKPHLVIFLSEGWADLVKQPVPDIWKKLSLKEKEAAVQAYCERVARHFQQAGVTLDSVAIGNEIDFGICGEYEAEWSKRVSLPYMEKEIWPKMAGLLKAGQAGVLKVVPQARFVVHLAQWDNAVYADKFYTFMKAQGVRLDQLGLSYYPSAVKGEKTSFDFFFQQVETLSRKFQSPVVIPEYAYPSERKFSGQFASWNNEADGYPLDAAGQKKWLQEFQKRVKGSPFIEASYYWSPEWYDSPMWPAFALFDEQGRAKPALDALSASS